MDGSCWSVTPWLVSERWSRAMQHCTNQQGGRSGDQQLKCNDRRQQDASTYECAWLARGGKMHVEFPVVSIGLEALTKEQLRQVAVSVKLEQAMRCRRRLQAS